MDDYSQRDCRNSRSDVAPWTTVPTVTSMGCVKEPATRPAPGDPLLGELLRKLIATLPESQRMAMVLRYQEDLDPTEIAEVMGIPVGTVKSHIQRSLGLLREKLARRGVGER